MGKNTYSKTTENFIFHQTKTTIMEYTREELINRDTIEQAWDGDELKIDDGDVRVWLTNRENRLYNGDYTVEKKIKGIWIQQSHSFNY